MPFWAISNLSNVCGYFAISNISVVNGDLYIREDKGNTGEKPIKDWIEWNGKSV
jgi:hypothetical protein